MIFAKFSFQMFRQVRNLSFKARLPNYAGLNKNSTLGEVYERFYTKYQYRLVYPIVGWVGFLYYTLWTPYVDPKLKLKQKERMDYLKSLEYSDE